MILDFEVFLRLEGKVTLDRVDGLPTCWVVNQYKNVVLCSSFVPCLFHFVQVLYGLTSPLVFILN
jgi:hypothetical protein